LLRLLAGLAGFATAQEIVALQRFVPPGLVALHELIAPVVALGFVAPCVVSLRLLALALLGPEPLGKGGSSRELGAALWIWSFSGLVVGWSEEAFETGLAVVLRSLRRPRRRRFRLLLRHHAFLAPTRSLERIRAPPNAYAAGAMRLKPERLSPDKSIRKAPRRISPSPFIVNEFLGLKKV
jgi:hypothetical protein